MLLLTPREKKLLRRLAQGKTDQQIATEIGGRKDQIALQRKSLIERLQVQSQEQLEALVHEFASYPERSVEKPERRWRPP
ncbi:transcriptional regulatory protein [Bradyrhizobium diazoefficiens USDA 110]|uniref:Transcriptional regulatory protein n=2 Tax=Bradyrhizobium diazoefficiens TaxID=1355477 RepID=Q89JU0_BRADU|nr:hypothetical protein AAV28_23270 [Bradyrhizobium diazoefficiens USDA 110]PDT59744.1 hypothetical protein CO678_22650 [Bradyrhizobium diazoefficiens]QBP23961.1 hypothetical protein Bdiaspc4_27230 [Bradyrhizobium diazoefficiens]BAC50444.1 transcriptional regulatory protein [Bradyrhizobium diazoefficiens USDA 110]BBZ95900.1 transcriptional regulator [Bradyrhizobium diazoefficiens]